MNRAGKIAIAVIPIAIFGILGIVFWNMATAADKRADLATDKVNAASLKLIGLCENNHGDQCKESMRQIGVWCTANKDASVCHDERYLTWLVDSAP